MNENFIFNSHHRPPYPQPQCRICGLMENLRRCSRCHWAYYCSQDHQRLDWKTHKIECHQIQEPLFSPQQPPHEYSLQQPPPHEYSPRMNTIHNQNEHNQQIQIQPLMAPPTLNSNQYSENLNITQPPTQAQTAMNDTLESEMNQMFLPESFSIDELLDLDHIDVDHILNENSFMNNINTLTVDNNHQLNNMQLTQMEMAQKPTTMMAPMTAMARDIINSGLTVNEYMKYQSQSAISQQPIADNSFELQDTCSVLIRDMNEYGVCVLDNFLGPERGIKVLEEVTGMHHAGIFKVSKMQLSATLNSKCEFTHVDDESLYSHIYRFIFVLHTSMCFPSLL